MKEYTVVVDDVQRRIIVNALFELRTEQVKQGKSYGFIDDIIRLFSEDSVNKEKKKFYEARQER